MGFFDKHYHYTETAPAYPQTVNVTEKRAPTDESVKILRDMEERARQHVLQTFHVENSVVDGIVVVFQLSPSDFSRYAYIRFSINGKEHHLRERLDDRLEFNEQQAVETFARAVRDSIFNLLLPKIAEEYEKSRRKTHAR